MQFLTFDVCCTKCKTTVDKFVAEIYNPVVVVLEHGNVLIICHSFSVQSPIDLTDRNQAGSSLEAMKNNIFLRDAGTIYIIDSSTHRILTCI